MVTKLNLIGTEAELVVTTGRMEDLGLALFETSGKLRRRQEKVLKSSEFPLTYRQYRALYRIEEGHDSVTAIANLATIGLPSVSAAVSSMVDRGMVERNHDGDDHRSHSLSLTPKGLAALDAGNARMRALASELFAQEPIASIVESDIEVAEGFVSGLIVVLQEMAATDRKRR